MKKVLSFTLCIFALSTVVSAHPPKSINLEFNNNSKTLTADVEHGSRDRNKHYISKVTVKLNGKEIIVQEPASQRPGRKQIFIYSIPDAEFGDKIELEADCSVYGSKKEKIVVKEREERKKDKDKK